MVAVRHIAMGPVVVYVGAVYAAFGLSFGWLLLFNPFLVGTTDETATALGANLLRYGLMVLGTGIWGAMLGAIAVVVYNRLTRWTGGIRMEWETLGPETGEATQAQPNANEER